MEFPPSKSAGTLTGIACGVGASLLWAAGFVAARHGIDIGFSPADLTLHRCVWAGFLFLPLMLRDGAVDLRSLGATRAIVLTVLGGPGLALLSFSGFILVPLGHGGVIQPSCAALGGLLLATLILGERLPAQRAFGAAVMVAGLAVIGAEALSTIGLHGIGGDLLFAAAGSSFATFGMLLRKWRLPAVRATAIVSVVSLGIIPVYAALVGFDRILALGFKENALQAVLQGILAGPASIFLFTRSVVLLGGARASVFPALVPPFVLLIGWLALGQPPSLPQLAGLALVLVGFRWAQKS